jgi:hypothetical protein
MPPDPVPPLAGGAGAAGRIRQLRGASWVGAGLLDQFVIACANAGNTLLGLVLLERHRAGLMVLSLGIAYLAMYINRAFVGDVLIALSSRYDGARRDRLVRNGFTTAATAGVVGCLIFVAIWTVWPRGGDTDLRDLIWIAPFLPAIMLHDTARCSYLANRQPARALVIDLVWAGTQAVLVTVLIVTHTTTAGGLLAAWGLGAAAGATTFAVLTRTVPWRGNPRRWFAETRFLSGWFTATALIGQFQVQAVNFIVAVQLTSVEVSGLRFAQTVLVQPVQNLITAVQGLLVPRNSRKAHAAARSPGPEGEAAATALRRQTGQLALAAAVLGALLVVVVWPLAEFVLSRVHKFADVAPLALPISLQAAAYLVQLPFAAALRGMHRARMLFAQYVVYAGTALSLVVVGAAVGHLEGAAWGLAVAAFVGLLTMMGLYAYAQRFLGQPEVEHVAEDEVTGTL